jgi:16S rRNA U516 pseudouridylate synthase RsuA-like enzyme
MNISLDTKVGEWRHLSSKELSEINKMVSDSTKVI